MTVGTSRMCLSRLVNPNIRGGHVRPSQLDSPSILYAYTCHMLGDRDRRVLGTADNGVSVKNE